MNAIVIVSGLAPDVPLLTAQATAGRGSDLVRRSFEDNAKADLHQQPEPDQPTPPFWTWFIENPRNSSV
jgi:hypothetical protein